ncbi:MAG: hypothetical protein IT306_21445 [Chloroflexi bacterium]|nr:hypothetical protein [Chloroflexota bacterium]
MADRRRGLIVALALLLASLGASMAACGLPGAYVESAMLSRQLGGQGYTGVGVTVTFNSVNGVRKDTLTVTLDRPPAAATDEQAAGDVAAFTLECFPRIDEVEKLVIVLKSASVERSFARSPRDWREHVFLMTQPPGIGNAVTALSTFGDRYEPRGVVSDFAADQPIFHAVITIQNLPAGSVVKALWVAVDAHGETPPNTVLTATEARVEGSRNIDFTLEPTAGRLPRGMYRVDILLDGQLSRTLPFTVAGG